VMPSSFSRYGQTTIETRNRCAPPAYPLRPSYGRRRATATSTACGRWTTVSPYRHVAMTPLL
jgi:hypothetical protein